MGITQAVTRDRGRSVGMVGNGKPGTRRSRSWISLNPEAEIISRSITVTGAGASSGDCASRDAVSTRGSRRRMGPVGPLRAHRARAGGNTIGPAARSGGAFADCILFLHDVDSYDSMATVAHHPG